MRLAVDGAVYRGRAVTLDASLDPRTVARAVRAGTATADGVTVAVTSRRPPPVHERVGCLSSEMGLRVRTALAAAGRARGLSTPHDAELRSLRAELGARDTPDVETAPQRRSVAEATAETDRLRERVAETRGRLAEARDADRDAPDLANRLETAARDLSEAETSAVAARQALARRRTEARTARDDLERRFRLEDDLANCRRRARAVLVDRLRDAFESAVVDAPGGPETRPDDLDSVDSLTAGLAVARVADFDAPVVVACDRFADATAASAWLSAPVVRVR